MAFTSFVFLLFFMPVVVLLFYAIFVRTGQVNIQRTLTGQKVFLIFSSILFYAWGEPKRLILMLSMLILNFLLLKWAEAKPGKLHNVVTIILIGLNLLALIYGKFLAESLPLGLSFYTFRLLSAAIDRNRAKKQGDIKPLHILDYALYISFFPQVISGPIQRYDDFTKQVQTLEVHPHDLVLGLKRFLPALVVKVLVADQIFGLRTSLLDVSNLGSAEAWLGAFFYTIYIYLDFASYSAMAIGLSRIFGIHSPENFRTPYSAVSVSDFWRRWHMSLSFFFRDYVYIPLGGNRKGTGRQIINILVVWSLTGLWHGSTWNFLLWGLYYALWLLAEKFILMRVMDNTPTKLRQVFTFLIVHMGWVLFAFPQASELLSYLRTMFGANGLSNGQALYTISANLVLILVAILLCTPIAERLKHPKHKYLSVLYQVILVILIILSIAYLVDQSFQSFLYFQF